MAVQIESISPGDNLNFPSAGSVVQVHYTARLSTGEKFDSSRERGRIFEFTVGSGSVIRGWDIAIPKLSIGERAMLTIPPNSAYGKKGVPGLIPTDAILIFDVQLLAFY